MIAINLNYFNKEKEEKFLFLDKYYNELRIFTNIYIYLKKMNMNEMQWKKIVAKLNIIALNIIIVHSKSAYLRRLLKNENTQYIWISSYDQLFKEWSSFILVC